MMMMQLTPELTRSAEAGSVAGPPKIEVRNLDFFYGKTQALTGVDLGMPAHAVTAIIGPSGCGKSTLLRAINRIYELYPDQRASGQIVIDGENVLEPSYALSKLRRCVGMVFQKPTPFATTIRKNVAFALSYYERLSKSELADRVEDALAVEQDLAGGALARVQRVDAVEHAQQGRLAAARRPDQRGDALFRHIERDVLDRAEVAVPEVEPARGELRHRRRVSHGAPGGGRRRRARGGRPGGRRA